MKSFLKIMALLVAGVITSTFAAVLSGAGERPETSIGAWVKFPGSWEPGKDVIERVQKALVMGDLSSIQDLVAKDYMASDISLNLTTKTGGTLRYVTIVMSRPGKKIILKDVTLTAFSSDTAEGGSAGNRLGTNQTWEAHSNFAFGVNYSGGNWTLTSIGQNTVPFDAIGVIADPKMFNIKSAGDEGWIRDNVLMLLGTVSVKEEGVERFVTRTAVAARGFVPSVVKPTVRNDKGTLVLSFSTGNLSSQFYEVETSANVTGPWTSLKVMPAVANGTVSFRIPTAGTAGGFFRVRSLKL